MKNSRVTIENHEGVHIPPKKAGRWITVSQLLFMSSRLPAGRLQLILDQELRPNLPLLLLHGTKLKWLCVALEQIACGIYGSSPLPPTGRTGEGSIVLTHNAIMIKVVRWKRRAPVHFRQHDSSPATSESLKKSRLSAGICSTPV